MFLFRIMLEREVSKGGLVSNWRGRGDLREESDELGGLREGVDIFVGHFG